MNLFSNLFLANCLLIYVKKSQRFVKSSNNTIFSRALKAFAVSKFWSSNLVKSSYIVWSSKISLKICNYGFIHLTSLEIASTYKFAVASSSLPKIIASVAVKTTKADQTDENFSDPSNYCLFSLLSPCMCKGTHGFVHQQCLEYWLSRSGLSHCELCLFHFPTAYHLR